MSDTQHSYFTRERLTRFTDALRSGEYRKNLGSLVNKNEDGSFCYCALGVLCKVEGYEVTDLTLDPGDFKITGTDVGFFYPEESYILTHVLPVKLDRESGGWFQSSRSSLEYGGIRYCNIPTANDRGVPWDIIADHIDKNYPCSDEPPKEVA